jgi:hypothetical protein
MNHFELRFAQEYNRPNLTHPLQSFAKRRRYTVIQSEAVLQAQPWISRSTGPTRKPNCTTGCYSFPATAVGFQFHRH